MAFTFYTPVQINAAQVPTTQTDFPVLVSVTDNRFRTVGNGGHVQNSSGFDIRPFTDISLNSAITGYDLEFYDGVNGILVMWVKVSSLSSSTTPFGLAYGNTSIGSDASSPTTWSNSFVAVYHLKDGTTLSVADSAGSNNGTNHSVTAATGQIDGGGGFASASSQYVVCGTAIDPAAITVSAWVKATTLTSDYNAVMNRGAGGGDKWGIFVKSTGKLYMNVQSVARSYDGTGSHTLSTGTWYYLTMTYNSSAGLIGYVNAASDGTATANGTIPSGAFEVDIGKQQATAGSRFWNGLIDEARVSSVARSADWITTEYNNQFAPGTFETLGTETNPTPPAGLFRL